MRVITVDLCVLRTAEAEALIGRLTQRTGLQRRQFLVNFVDMTSLPTWEAQALAMHEGLPGHHIQKGVAVQRRGLSPFRRTLSFTGYVEGWGLYAEQLAHEQGLFTDPWQDFGRLSLSLWRAGDTLMVPLGAAYEWDSAEPVRKLYCSFTPDAAARAAGAE